ncbi:MULTISPECIES: hypothetical protein [Alteribacter]|nr:MULTISPECIES: hypothetical protein [Alteribacter]MBM7096343.1 hypothetical protein [Alteribacter salitolerans]
MKPAKEPKFTGHVQEAFKGLFLGLAMMLIVFLLLHFVFGIEAFQK